MFSSPRSCHPVIMPPRKRAKMDTQNVLDTSSVSIAPQPRVRRTKTQKTSNQQKQSIMDMLASFNSRLSSMEIKVDKVKRQAADSPRPPAVKHTNKRGNRSLPLAIWRLRTVWWLLGSGLLKTRKT